MELFNKRENEISNLIDVENGHTIPETEDEVMNHIESLQGRVTIILITHSKSALKNCNKIFNLNKGSVI